MAKAWREDRANVTSQASEIAAALAERATPLRGAGAPGQAALAEATDQAVRALAGDYDAAQGGFGGAPKFPPSMVLEFLLRHTERGGPGAAQALAMAEGTAEAMARGGMYDQLAGGFARYSWTPAGWCRTSRRCSTTTRCWPGCTRTCGGAPGRRWPAGWPPKPAQWMLAELRTPEGGLAAALDADSDGAEGLFYTWTPAELTDALGAQDGEWAALAFSVTGSGTFEHGRSVLQRRADPSDAERLAQVRGVLLARRGQRVRPARDDKVVAAWNGLAIAALAEAGLLLGEATFVAAARDAAGLLHRVHLAGGRLARTSRDGAAGRSAGVLDDYACVAEGFLALSGVTGEARWVTLAGQLLDTALDRFGDGSGGFYDTADDGEKLVYRPADPADGPTPSGAFAAAGALLSYAALSGSERHRAAAVAALGVLQPIAGRFPRAAGWGLAVAEALLSGPAEIAVVGPPGAAGTAELHRAALHAAPPGAVLALGDGSGPGNGADSIELLAGRGLVNGGPAAYVCRNFSCLAPVTEPDALRAALGQNTG